jgi:hypothetical protein
MKRLVLKFASIAIAIILIATSAHAFVHSSGLATGSPPPIPYIILDNDSGGDIDDLSDRRMLNTLAVNGLIHVVADITDDSDPYGVTAVKAYQTYQGTSYPLYSYQGNDLQYVPGTYTQSVASTFNPGDSRTNYASCEAGYRSSLTGSLVKVTIIMNGFSKCIDQLLNSPANDNGDGLPSGLSIIQAHVLRVIWTAGSWPNGTNDFNLTGGDHPNPSYPVAAASTQDLLANWPSTVPFYFYGTDQTTTAKSGPFPFGICVTSGTDPYQYGFFQSSPGNPCVRFLWGQPMFIFTMNTSSSLFTIGGANGTATFNASTGVNTWTSTPGPFSYITNVASQSVIQNAVCVQERWGSTNWC